MPQGLSLCSPSSVIAYGLGDCSVACDREKASSTIEGPKCLVCSVALQLVVLEIYVKNFLSL